MERTNLLRDVMLLANLLPHNISGLFVCSCLFLFAFETNSNYQKFVLVLFAFEPHMTELAYTWQVRNSLSDRHRFPGTPLVQASQPQFSPTLFTCHNFHSHPYLDLLTLAMFLFSLGIDAHHTTYWPVLFSDPHFCILCMVISQEAVIFWSPNVVPNFNAFA